MTLSDMYNLKQWCCHYKSADILLGYLKNIGVIVLTNACI